MPLDYSIRPVIHGSGYRIVRVADQETLATYETYGEASRNLDVVGLRDSLTAQFPEFGQLSPAVQQLAVALEQAAFEDDDPRVTVVDDGERSGIRLARYDVTDRTRTWLDFSIGDAVPSRILVGVDLVGGDKGLELIIGGRGITSDGHPWTLAQLQQLHSDIGRLLADERLIGALAEQEGQR